MIRDIGREIQRRLGLTSAESGVLLFLSLGLLGGGVVKLFHLDTLSEKYDFRESDTFFAEASSRIDSVLRSDEDTSSARTVRSGSSRKALTGVVNVNTADADSLAMVPGIGRVTAQRIIDHRLRNGRFKSLDDLLKVKGIGEKKLSKMKPYLRAF